MSKIYRKLFLSYVLVVFICLGLIGIITSISLKNYYRDRLAHELKTNAILLQEILDINDTNKLQEMVQKLKKKINARITVIRNDGEVLADSDKDPDKMENHGNRPEIREALSNTLGQSIRFSNTLKIDMMYVAIPIKEKNVIKGVIRLALPLTEVKEKIVKINKIIAYSLFIGAIISLILGALIGRSFTAPLTEMRAFAKRIIKGDFSQKIRIRSKDEIGELGKILNEMAHQLKERINALIENKNKIEAIISNMKEGVVVIDGMGNIILLNSSFKELVELRAENYINRPFWEIIANNEINTILKRALNERTSFSKEISIFKPENRFIKIQTAPVFIKENELIGVVGVFHDITEIRRLERVREEFIANITHELKTPVTSIIGFLETLKNGVINNSKKRNEFLDIIYFHAKRLANLIEDILTLSKIESRKTEMNFRSIPIIDILEETCFLYRDKIKSKELGLRINIPENLPPVRGDFDQLITVFSNLLDNAIKFNKNKGKIIIEAKEENDFIKIDITDTGIGIPKEHISRIFERFYRVDKARSREFGGTGLGLAIVKHIVKAHQGKITVKSQRGKGSTFSIFLPKVTS